MRTTTTPKMTLIAAPACTLIRMTLLFVALLGGSHAFAEDEIYTSYFSSKALSGYDTVAYFTENKPVEGKSKYSMEYKGATWLFSSQDNLEKFKAEPEKYAPQYGGYCAWAVAHDATAKGDPEQWHIHDGKLYINYDASIQAKWLPAKVKLIADANKNWPKVLN